MVSLRKSTSKPQVGTQKNPDSDKACLVWTHGAPVPSPVPMDGYIITSPGLENAVHLVSIR